MKRGIRLFLLGTFIINMLNGYSQIGVNTESPDTSSAMLHIQATDKGILIPRSENNPKEEHECDGLLYFNTQINKFVFFNGDAGNWEVINPFNYDNNSTLKNDSVEVYSALEGRGTIPQGGIIMWSGEENDIPDGYAICDGDEVKGFETPDLSGRFIVGCHPQYYSIDDSGGLDSVSLTVNQIPNHSHTGETGSNNNTDFSHDHEYNDFYYAPSSEMTTLGIETVDYGHMLEYIIPHQFDGDIAVDQNSHTSMGGELFHLHYHPIENVGNNEAHNNLPKYYVLAYIMRVN